MRAVRVLGRYAVTFATMQVIGWAIGFVVMPWTSGVMS